MKVKTLCVLVLLLGGSLATSQTVTRCGGPTTALQINWPTFHFDNCRSGNNPYEQILSPSTVAGLELKWISNNNGTASSPILSNGVLYFYSRWGTGGYLVAVDTKTGSTIWSQENPYGSRWPMTGSRNGSHEQAMR